MPAPPPASCKFANLSIANPSATGATIKQSGMVVNKTQQYIDYTSIGFTTNTNLLIKRPYLSLKNFLTRNLTPTTFKRHLKDINGCYNMIITFKLALLRAAFSLSQLIAFRYQNIILLCSNCLFFIALITAKCRLKKKSFSISAFIRLQALLKKGYLINLSTQKYWYLPL